MYAIGRGGRIGDDSLNGKCCIFPKKKLTFVGDVLENEQCQDGPRRHFQPPTFFSRSTLVYKYIFLKILFFFFFFYSHLGLPSPLQHPKPDRVSDVGRSIRSSGLLLYVCPRNRRNSFQFLLHPWGCFFFFSPREEKSLSQHTHTHSQRHTRARNQSGYCIQTALHVVAL